MKRLNKNSILKFIAIYVPVVVLILGIGYASVSYDLSVSGSIAMTTQDDIAIINVSPSTYVENYNKTVLTTSLELSNASDTKTMSVSIKNLGNSKQIFDGIVYDSSQSLIYSNSNIVPSVSGITENSSVINSNGNNDDTITFTLSFGYLNTSNITDNALDGTISFHFTPLREITYVNCTNSSSLSSEYIRSKSFTNMNNVTYIPSVTIANAPASITITDASNNTLISGTNYTYSNGVVTFLTEITSNLTITAASSGGTTIVQGDYDLTYLASASDGIYRFEDVAGEPEVEVKSGKIISFEYKNPGTGVSFSPSSGSVDTGLLAFDGTGFEIDMVYTLDTASNTGDYVLSALEKEGNKYYGFIFYVYSSNMFYLRGTQQTKSTNINNFGNNIGSGFRTTTGGNTYTFHLRYDPTVQGNPQVVVSQTPVAYGNSSYNVQSQYIPTSMPNATIAISGNNVLGSTDKFVTMTVHSFKVSKL